MAFLLVPAVYPSAGRLTTFAGANWTREQAFWIAGPEANLWKTASYGLDLRAPPSMGAL
jgi:hypothetical protein